MWSITLDGKLHLAPIGPNPHSVLDIATGTGIPSSSLPPTFSRNLNVSTLHGASDATDPLLNNTSVALDAFCRTSLFPLPEFPPNVQVSTINRVSD